LLPARPRNLDSHVLVTLLGVPYALRKKLESPSPTAAQIAELAGILGIFTIILASLILAAGELPPAQAYVEASEEARPAIVAIYEWQRLATALLFDVFGFFLLRVSVFASSVTGLRSGGLPKGIGWFGGRAARFLYRDWVRYQDRMAWGSRLGRIGFSCFARQADLAGHSLVANGSSSRIGNQ
jgi:hypothetical protein